MLDAAARPMPADLAALLPPVTAAQCWQLHRTCVLTPRQFLASYAVLLAISAVVALVASLQGWWIVAVYCALEMLGAGALWLLYMVHAVDGERITLAPGEMLTVDLAHGLHQRHVVMNPAWTRLERCRSRNQRETLWLCCSQTRIEVASQCGLLQKQRLERELRQALAAWEGQRRLGQAETVRRPLQLEVVGP